MVTCWTMETPALDGGLMAKEDRWNDETYALVVVTGCWDKTEVVKERMTIRALKGFMRTRAER